MIATKPIIAGIDLGQETEAVVSYAAYFASSQHTGLHLLYVIDYLLTPPSYLSDYVEEEKERDKAELASWELRLEREGIDTECGILLGRLHESFVKAIEEVSPQLLVIGFKSHVIRPSSSERLVKSLKVPVLVVRGEKASGATIGSVGVKRILCPVDFSDNSRKAAGAAVGYASLFSAELDLVNVVPSYRIREEWPAWKKLTEAEKEKFGKTVCSASESRLDAFCNEMKIEKKGIVSEGRPAETIVSRAGEGGYDLIVIGARGLSYVQSIFIGGTTEAVLKSSPCPVLVIH